VYADSFVADETGTVDELGTWLLSQAGAGAGSNITFMVLGDAAGPNPNDVIASTGSLDIGGGTATLDLYTAAPAFSGVLNAGSTYWFAASAVGEDPNGGSYQTGGHTQNSVYNDNGTFWFSNDPTGQNFDGQGFTPEMAFSVSIVPAPGAAALLGLGGLVALRRRR
jgi:MYXO-CTERM domain-containing protein